MARARRNRDDPSRHLTLLDMGVDASPLRPSLDLGGVPRLLRLAPGGALGAGAEPFPARGELPRAFKPITFLDFVENGVPCISHACVAVGTMKDGALHTTGCPCGSRRVAHRPIGASRSTAPSSRSLGWRSRLASASAPG